MTCNFDELHFVKMCPIFDGSVLTDFEKSILKFAKLCVSVRTKCPNASTPSFFARFEQQAYLWNPYDQAKKIN